MADAVDPTNEDNAAETETDNEVEAHPRPRWTSRRWV